MCLDKNSFPSTPQVLGLSLRGAVTSLLAFELLSFPLYPEHLLAGSARCLLSCVKCAFPSLWVCYASFWANSLHPSSLLTVTKMCRAYILFVELFPMFLKNSFFKNFKKKKKVSSDADLEQVA